MMPRRQCPVRSYQNSFPGSFTMQLISDIAPSLEQIFGLRCNDTPVVRELSSKRFCSHCAVQANSQL